MPQKGVVPPQFAGRQFKKGGSKVDPDGIPGNADDNLPPDTLKLKKKMKGLNATIRSAMQNGKGMAKKPFAQNSNDWMSANDSLNKARGMK